MTFQELGLTPAILSALAELDYTAPTPIQAGAIPPALQGRDVLGIAQTGTGKTCAFAAPILQRLAQAHHKGPRLIRALILTPTRELALQIQESFELYGKQMPLVSAVIFGGVGQQPQVDKLRKGVDILVATPGRLLDLHGQGLLDLSHVEIFVLDEADRMLDMGFIHDVKRVIKLLPEKKQTLFFSATMPPEVTELVNALLHDPARVAVTPVSSPVEAIRQSLYFVDKKNKTRLLAMLVEEPDVKNALVFSRTKHGANKIAQDLNKMGISAAAIHGNKSQTARVQALSDFKAGRIKVLAATDIAARGIDIEELSHVFNYNLPDVPETYVHRIGRTGRAGREGVAVSFCEFGEKDDLKGIEKLLGRHIPVVEDHPFPMEVFEAPKRDKNGKIINAEDQEAREAARERKRERSRTGELGRSQERAQGRKRPEDQPASEGNRPGRAANASVTKQPKKPEPVKPVLKTAPAPKPQPNQKPKSKPAADLRTPGEKRQAAGYKASKTLDEALRAVSPKEENRRKDRPIKKALPEPAQTAKSERDLAFERWMEEERAIQAGQAAKHRRGLGDDEVIMDATARLLAPKTPPKPQKPVLTPVEKPEQKLKREPKQSSKAVPKPDKPVRSAPAGAARKEKQTSKPVKPPKQEAKKPVKPAKAQKPAPPPKPAQSAAGAGPRPARSEKPAKSASKPAQKAPAKPANLSLEERKAKIREAAKARRAKGPLQPTLRPSTQKDSTEQESLMKPYYLGDDDE